LWLHYLFKTNVKKLIDIYISGKVKIPFYSNVLPRFTMICFILIPNIF